jgi:RNA polymerase sigma-70 factor (ECF subfamily)
MSKLLNNEAVLVEQAKSGQKRAFESLVDQSLPGLMGFFRYLEVPYDTMDDLVQETYLRAYKSFGSFDPSRRFVSWLLSIGRNVRFDFNQKHKIQPVAQEETKEESVLPDEENIEKKLVVERLLDSLPDKDKALIELRIYQDLPFKEIAAMTGESEGALRVRLHRIFQILRGKAQKEGLNHA